MIKNMLKEQLNSFINMCLNRYRKRTSLDHVSWMELFYYCVRQFFHFYNGTFTKSITNYKIIDENLASIRLGDKELFFPKSMGTLLICLLLREALDKKHWHQYDTKYTPVNSDDVLVDCGASEGIWSLSIINKVKKIYLLEPQTNYCDALKKTFSSFPDEKVEIINCAAGNSDGKCEISKSGLVGKVSYNTEGYTSIYKLDTLFADKKISFIKADIEGFEFEMLKGAKNIIQRDKPKIAVAVYHDANNWQEIKNYLTSIVLEYKFIKKGLVEKGKPLMLHAWVD